MTRGVWPLCLPRYVSTVDSGNLAACLCILSQACQQLQHDAPMLRWSRWEGMADTFGLLDDFMSDLETAQNIPAAGELRVLARELRDGVRAVKAEPAAWRPALDYVAGEGWQRLETLLTRLVEENATVLGTAALGALRIAAGRISNQIFTFHRAVELALARSCLARTNAHHCSAIPEMPRRAGRAQPCVGRDRLQAVPSFAEHPAACATAEAALDRLVAALDQLPAGRYDADPGDRGAHLMRDPA